MFKSLLTISLLFGNICASESITSSFQGYRTICERASYDLDYFNHFRSMTDYRIVLELEKGQAFADYIVNSDSLLKNIETYRALDGIGNPPLESFEGLGEFTSTTLRYVVLADQINKLFTLPDQAIIAEIGVGFGGQCYVLSKMNSFQQYFLYDLPEVELLVDRVLKTLNVPNTQCLPIHVQLPVDTLDLVISNYAFSECDRDMQLYYYENVIKKAKRGYIIYNQISEDFWNIHSLHVDEFVAMLRNDGFRPRVFHEFLSTAPGNMLITWDLTRTRKRD